MQNIGTKIRILREAKGFTQEELANRLEITQGSYSNLERGETELSISRLHQICEILEVNVLDLIALDDKFFFTNCNGPVGINNGNVTINERQLFEEKIQLLLDKVNMMDELLNAYRQLHTNNSQHLE